MIQFNTQKQKTKENEEIKASTKKEKENKRIKDHYV